jgi:hypothetical protein
MPHLLVVRAAIPDVQARLLTRQGGRQCRRGIVAAMV